MQCNQLKTIQGLLIKVVKAYWRLQRKVYSDIYHVRKKKALEMELAAKNIFSLYHKAFKTMNLDLLSNSVCYSTKALVLNVEELQVVSESMISSSLKKKKMNTTMQVVQICLLFRMRSNVIGLESALNNNFCNKNLWWNRKLLQGDVFDIDGGDTRRSCSLLKNQPTGKIHNIVATNEPQHGFGL